MKRTVLVFGLISGMVSSLMMLCTMPFLEKIGSQKGYIIGYTGIVLSFLLVYFGIRSYRDNVEGGQITFAKGFGVGILITLISCVFYVLTWEVIYFNFMHDSMDKYGAHLIAKMQASGASQAAIQAQLHQLTLYKENPLFNAAMTFIEPFPVGFVITLISAAILRRRPQALSGQAVQPTSS
jgi:hypothetical protein